MERIVSLSKSDIKDLIKVWESSVKATHHFLDAQDIRDLRVQVEAGLKFVDVLVVIRDHHNTIIAFEGIHDHKIEMLFIDDNHRGKGLGKKLLAHAIETYGAKKVDVNEQNPQGLGFYQHMGFDVVSRSETDDAGNPFPILHLSL